MNNNINNLFGEVIFIRKKIKDSIKHIFNKPNDKILDIGCGKNPFYKDVIAGNIIGFDRFSSKTVIEGNANNPLPFPDRSFDKIILANSLYYLDNPFEVIKEVYRILKPRGILFISLPFFYPVHDIPDDKYRFTEFGVRTILKKYFVITKLEAIGGIFTIPSILVHNLIKGIQRITKPKTSKWIIYIFLYIPYMALQFVGLLDTLLPITKRWATYYVVVAQKPKL